MEVANGIFLVKIPLPFQLESVNCYLIKDTSGWFLLDTGVNNEPVRDAWSRALKGLGLHFSDIKRILVTHYHPDHYGAAGWFQQCSRADVYMSRIDFTMAEVVWNESSSKKIANQEHLTSNGVPADVAEEIELVMGLGINWVKPRPMVKLLEDGDTLNIGGENWEVLITPGHSSGHICLYNKERKIIVSGDQLLQEITSNVSFFPGSSQNPLKDYLGSLIRLKKLDINLLLPAHGDIFNSAQIRISDLFRHHDERLEAVYRAVGGGRTAFEVSQAVFGRGLPLNDTRFALGETIAHLKYLVNDGKIAEDTREDIIVYHQIGV